MKQILALLLSLAMGISQSAVLMDKSQTVPCVVERQYSREGVPEFLAIVGNIQGDGLLSGADFSQETCYNVTPERVARETDIRIFMYSKTGLSLSLIDGEVYPICTWFGGWGFMDAVPWDVDEDGLIDLIVLSSWGSGLHRDEISVFNRRTKESTVIYSTADEKVTLTGLSDLCFDEGPYEDDEGLHIDVYRTNDMVCGDGYMSYTKADYHGTIKLVDGQPVYIRR